MAQMVLSADQPDELLGRHAGLRDFERPRGGRSAHECLNLAQGALRPGAPEYLAERRKSGDFRDYDPVNRDRVGGEDEIEKTPAERRQRGADIGGVEFPRRKSLEMALAHAPHHCAKELFLPGEMS